MSFYHGHYRQHQYFPLLAFDGETGFPLAAWLRPGTVHASCGAIDTVREIVAQLRKAWPDVAILWCRGDGGFAVPAMYEYCEQDRLVLRVQGTRPDNTLKQRTDEMLSQTMPGNRRSGEAMQRFRPSARLSAQALGRRARRILAKVEVNRQGYKSTLRGDQRCSGDPQGLYHGFYVEARQCAREAPGRTEERAAVPIG